MIKKNFIYAGLGFPVIFAKVEVREVMGELVPHVNHRKLQDLAFRALLMEKMRLSGSHLSFVRHYMGWKQEEIAKKLGLSGHSMISKWEAKKLKATGMSSAIEAAVRGLMREFLKESAIPLEEFTAFLSGDLDDPSGPLHLAA